MAANRRGYETGAGSERAGVPEDIYHVMDPSGAKHPNTQLIEKAAKRILDKPDEK